MYSERQDTMRRMASLAITVALMLAAVPAFACRPSTLEPTADCYGWEISGTMEFSTSTECAITYWVNLVQDGDTIAHFAGTGTVYAASPDFSYSSDWGMDLCGDYIAVGWFKFVANEGWGIRTFEIPFTCECEEPGACTYTPGYWKNHPDAWPVDNLTVGGVNYTQFRLMQIFDMPTGGDMTIQLFHHLVAAKLNVLGGSDLSIVPTIDAADAFLMDHHLFSKPKGDLKDMAEDLKDILCDYNEIPCPDDDDFDVLGASPREMLTSPATEETSWGALKKKTQ